MDGDKFISADVKCQNIIEKPHDDECATKTEQLDESGETEAIMPEGFKLNETFQQNLTESPFFIQKSDPRESLGILPPDFFASLSVPSVCVYDEHNNKHGNNSDSGENVLNNAFITSTLSKVSATSDESFQSTCSFNAKSLCMFDANSLGASEISSIPSSSFSTKLTAESEDTLDKAFLADATNFSESNCGWKPINRQLEFVKSTCINRKNWQKLNNSFNGFDYDKRTTDFATENGEESEDLDDSIVFEANCLSKIINHLSSSTHDVSVEDTDLSTSTPPWAEELIFFPDEESKECTHEKNEEKSDDKSQTFIKKGTNVGHRGRIGSCGSINRPKTGDTAKIRKSQEENKTLASKQEEGKFPCLKSEKNPPNSKQTENKSPSVKKDESKSSEVAKQKLSKFSTTKGGKNHNLDSKEKQKCSSVVKKDESKFHAPKLTAKQKENKSPSVKQADRKFPGFGSKPENKFKIQRSKSDSKVHGKSSSFASAQNESKNEESRFKKPVARVADALVKLEKSIRGKMEKGKEKGAKGPLKALIPVQNMSKGKTVLDKTASLNQSQIGGLTCTMTKTSTPNEIKLKSPLAQSTPNLVEKESDNKKSTPNHFGFSLGPNLRPSSSGDRSQNSNNQNIKILSSPKEVSGNSTEVQNSPGTSGKLTPKKGPSSIPTIMSSMHRRKSASDIKNVQSPNKSLYDCQNYDSASRLKRSSSFQNKTASLDKTPCSLIKSPIARNFDLSKSPNKSPSIAKNPVTKSPGNFFSPTQNSDFTASNLSKDVSIHKNSDKKCSVANNKSVVISGSAGQSFEEKTANNNNNYSNNNNSASEKKSSTKKKSSTLEKKIKSLISVPKLKKESPAK